MARKSRQISLSTEDRKELEMNHKQGGSHCFRQRCKMVLLKSEGFTSKEVAAILCTNSTSVHNWLKRYGDSGIEGLRTKSGQGRKRILTEEHLSIVRAAVKQERQRLSQAKQIVVENIGRKMSSATLTRFLKVMTAVTSG